MAATFRAALLPAALLALLASSHAARAQRPAASSAADRAAHAVSAPLAVPAADPPAADPRAARRGALELPLVFEANRGQASAGLDYLARGPGWRLGLGADGALFALAGGGTVRMTVDGAARVAPAGEAPLAGRVSYLVGRDRARWVRGAPLFARVAWRALLPGVDLVLYDGGGALEFDLELAPGADPRALALRFHGAERLELDAAGALRVHVGGATLVLSPPVSHQRVGAARRPVPSAFELRADGAVGFRVGAYDPGAPLVIDPVVTHAAFLGGSATDTAVGVHVDAIGRIHVGGSTASTDLPATGAFQPLFGGGQEDLWAARLAADGASIEYLTYLGGDDLDRCEGFAVDPSGRAVLAGSSAGAGFPVTAGAVQPLPGGLGDAVVAKLTADGDGLVFATYLGGFGADAALDVTTDATGDVYVTGRTGAADFPTTPGAFQTAPGVGEDAFVTRLDPNGALVYSTYFGAGSPVGGAVDRGTAVAVAGTEAWIVGETSSPDLPSMGPSLSAGPQGGRDLFVARFSGTGGLLFASYLGGAGEEDADTADAGVTASGDLVLLAQSASADFPVTPGALEETGTPAEDAVVVRLDLGAPSGFAWSTYWGSASAAARGRALDVAPDDSVWLGGVAVDGAFPLVDPIFTTFNNEFDGLLARLAADGASQRFATLLGAQLVVRGVAAAPGDDVVLAGTNGGNPSFAGAPPDADFGTPGSSDVFVARVDLTWTDAGCALAGFSGEPVLAGSGPLAAGSANAVTLGNAAPTAFTGVFLATSSAPVGFKGGTLKPFPFLLLRFTSTSPAGELALPFVMPAGVPAGTELWVQMAIQDSLAPLDVALSNAVLGVTP